MKHLSIVSLVLTMLGGSVLAEKMPGSEVAGLMGQGKIEFQAGSVWTTLPGNRYTFTHGGSAGEAGTFKIFSNGNVHILDEAKGRTIKFYFDKDDSGVPALIYTTGSGAGKRYPIK